MNRAIKRRKLHAQARAKQRVGNIKYPAQFLAEARRQIQNEESIFLDRYSLTRATHGVRINGAVVVVAYSSKSRLIVTVLPDNGGAAGRLYEQARAGSCELDSARRQCKDHGL